MPTKTNAVKVFGVKIYKTLHEIIDEVVEKYASYNYTEKEIQNYRWLLNNMSIGELLDEYIKWVR